LTRKIKKDKVKEMKVTVIEKEYASGTSKKANKDFSATVVHISHKKNGVDGLSVDSI